MKFKSEDETENMVMFECGKARNIEKMNLKNSRFTLKIESFLTLIILVKAIR